MIDLFSYVKSYFCSDKLFDDNTTTETYAKILLDSFNKTKPKEIDYACKKVKSNILAEFPEYNNYIIKLSPVHRKDNWVMLKKDNSTYIAAGIFYSDTDSNFKAKPFCFDRILIKIKDNYISIEETKQIDSYIDIKNILN